MKKNVKMELMQKKTDNMNEWVFKSRKEAG